MDTWAGNRFFFGQICSKQPQNCLLEMKFGTQTYSNMPNLMVMFISCFKPKKTILADLARRIKVAY